MNLKLGLCDFPKTNIRPNLKGTAPDTIADHRNAYEDYQRNVQGEMNSGARYVRAYVNAIESLREPIS